MSSGVKVSDGTIQFHAPNANKVCSTFYKVYGDLSGNVPLIALHGGPGAGHEYLQCFQDITIQHHIPVILYDQIGCGKSTALPEKNGDETFWTVDLFERELQNLGWTVGECVRLEATTRTPKARLNERSSESELEIEGTIKLRKQLPTEIQKTLQDYIDREEYDAPEFNDAVMEFYKRFFCRTNPWPEEVLASMGHLIEDSTVYGTMLGPCELVCTGNLKDWTAIPYVHQIQTATLMVNGEFDEITESTSAPFFRGIPKVKWVVIPDASHLNMWEKRERVMGIISDFLLDYS